jgi:2-keto-3-deoxy-L-rhamnonate aldolase RhmA
MDAGAHGVIVPMVNTREDAERALRSVQYPPSGTRGVGLARAQHYGLDIEGYRKWNEANSIVIVQIEDVRAIENLEAIFATGVDGFMVGPYDLSGLMDIPGQFEHERFREALEQVRKVAQKTGKPAGYHIVKPGLSTIELESRQPSAVGRQNGHLVSTARQGSRQIIRTLRLTSILKGGIEIRDHKGDMH